MWVWFNLQGDLHTFLCSFPRQPLRLPVQHLGGGSAHLLAIAGFLKCFPSLLPSPSSILCSSSSHPSLSPCVSCWCSMDTAQWDEGGWGDAVPGASWELTPLTCSECRSQQEQVPALHRRVQPLPCCLGLEVSLQRTGLGQQRLPGSAGLAGVQPASVQMQHVYSHQIV